MHLFFRHKVSRDGQIWLGYLAKNAYTLIGVYESCIYKTDRYAFNGQALLSISEKS